VALLLAAWVPAVVAASSGELPEKPAYQEMLTADRALESGDLPRALTAYQQALTLFERLRRERPDYKPAAIEYRMDYCRNRIAALLAEPSAQTTSPAEPKPADRLRELEAALGQLQAERETTQRELAALREDIRRANTRAETAEEQVRQLQSRLAATMERAAALEREAAEARDRVPAAEHRATLAALRAAETERDAMRRRAETAERQSALLAEKIAALERRLRELETAAASSQPNAEFKAQLEETRRQVQSAVRAQADALARAESLAAQLHAAREQIREIKAATASAPDAAAAERLAALERDLQRAITERDAAAAEAQRLRADLERLEAASRDDRERIRELGRALKAAAEPAARAEQELREQLRAALSERDAARDQAAALQARVTELESAQRSTASGGAEAVLAETREQLRRAEARLQALAAKLDLRDREAREIERERDALRSELDRVRTERDRLQLSLSRTTPSAEPASASSAPESPAPPASPELPPELRQQLDEASSLLSSNQPAPALQLYDRILTAAPDHADALLGYGRAALALGQLRPARAAAERLNSLYPELAGGHHLRGLIEARDNNPRNAGRAFAKAVALEPNNPIYHRDFAIACYKLNRLDDAIAEYREVIRLDPSDGKSHFNLAALLMMQRNPPLDEARALYRRALELGEPPDAQLEQRLAE